MSNFFERELGRVFGDGQVIRDPTYSGRACLGTLGKDLRVRAQFITSGYADHYDALKITVLNRTDGPVDTLVLKLKDLLGMKPVPGNPYFPNGVAPHIWLDQGKPEWYAFQPTAADYDTIRQAAKQYLDVFRDRQQERVQDQDGPSWCTSAPRSGERWRKTSSSPARKPRRCSRRATSLSAPISCSRLSLTRKIPSRIRRHRKWACGWWSPVSRSMSTGRSGRRECGRRSATPWIWALRSRLTSRPLGTARPAGRYPGKAKVRDEQ